MRDIQDYEVIEFFARHGIKVKDIGLDGFVLHFKNGDQFAMESALDGPYEGDHYIDVGIVLGTKVETL